MGKTGIILTRAIHRVALASTGEIIGRAVNLLLPLLLIKLYGLAPLIDVFFLALAIAFFFQGTLANSLTNALVPSFTENNDRKNAKPILYISLLGGVIAGLTTLSIAGVTADATRAAIYTCSIFIISCTGLASAAPVASLYANHRYALAGCTWGLRAFPVALYYFSHPSINDLHLLLAGLALADTARLAILSAACRNKLSICSNLPTLRAPTATLHLIAASVIAGLSPLLLRGIAAFGPEGTITLFEATDRLYSAIASLASIGVGSVTLVYLSRLRGNDDNKNTWRWILYATTSWSLLWLFIAITIGISLPGAASLFGINQDHHTKEIQGTFIILALGLPGFMLTGLLSRRMLTLGLAHHLTLLAIIGLSFTALSAFLMFDRYEILGLALATTLSHYLVAALMAIKLSSPTNRANTNTS
ncbi:lipid II flippase MurJ [Pseudomonas sp. AOB-7]|uniref:lipid II flippase MurJ n=1 Tax=Pseudomonas sp. AOB-7 TaxID=2482750 RepID=UPI001314C8C2|nr:lipid II flippase MurJ [Pseudomonas sp. AOB-7]